MCFESTMWYLEKLDARFLRPIRTKTQEKLVKSLPLLSKGNHWKNLYFISFISALTDLSMPMSILFSLEHEKALIWKFILQFE